jgi:hypothetical protein
MANDRTKIAKESMNLAETSREVLAKLGVKPEKYRVEVLSLALRIAFVKGYTKGIHRKEIDLSPHTVSEIES